MRRSLVSSLVALFLLASSTLIGLVPTAQAQLFSISEQQEILLGRGVERQLERSPGFVDDPSSIERVTEIGLKLARVSERPNLPWTYHILNDNSVNAFAVPGGFVFVNAGLLRFVQSDNELAFVLGHETTHVAHRHAVKRAQHDMLVQFGAVLLTQLAYGGDWTAYQLTQIARTLIDVKYSRDEESEADHYGVIYMQKAGFDPTGALTFMERLQSEERSQPSLLHAFEDHPDASARVAALRAELQQLGSISTAAASGQQLGPSTPWTPVVAWIEDLVASGGRSEQKVRDYYRWLLSSKSQQQVTEDQFVSYWQHTSFGAQPVTLSYNIVGVDYNETRDRARVTYRYRLFASDESSRTGANDVVLEGGSWKMVLWPEIIAEIQRAPAIQSGASAAPTLSSVAGEPQSRPPATAAQSPQPPVTSPSSMAPRAESFVELTVSSMTSTIASSGSSASSSATYYGAHLRWDSRASPWGFDLNYSTASLQGAGAANGYGGAVTYRLGTSEAVFRLGAGYEGGNASASGSGFSESITQSSPLLAVEGDFGLGSPELSLEVGAAYAPAVSGTLTVTVFGSTALGPVSGTEWSGFAGFRYTTPGVGGFTIAGGYNFSNANFNVGGTPVSTNSSGPYLSVGVAF